MAEGIHRQAPLKACLPEACKPVLLKPVAGPWKWMMMMIITNVLDCICQNHVFKNVGIMRVSAWCLCFDQPLDQPTGLFPGFLRVFWGVRGWMGFEIEGAEVGCPCPRPIITGSAMGMPPGNGLYPIGNLFFFANQDKRWIWLPPIPGWNSLSWIQITQKI